MTSSWWNEFFSGLWIDWQKSTPPQKSAEEVDFIEWALESTPGDRILDVPCGMGRHAIEMAVRGYDVTGVDVTESLLSEAQVLAQKNQAEVEWIQQDMRSLDFRAESFDAAICFWSSFGYFGDADNARFIKKVASSLVPGGKLILDTPVVETFIQESGFRTKDWTQQGDIYLLEERHWKPSTSRMDSKWTFVKSGRWEEHRASIRIYTYRELEDLMLNAGFQAFRTFSNLKGEPYATGERLFGVAVK